jgi:hypothetical protein
MSQSNNTTAADYAGQLVRDGATIYYLHTPQGDYIERPTLEAIAEEVRRHIPGRSCDECGRYVADGYADHDGGAFCSLVCAGWANEREYEDAWGDYETGAGDEPSTFWTTWEEPEEGWTPPPVRPAVPVQVPAGPDAPELDADPVPYLVVWCMDEDGDALRDHWQVCHTAAEARERYRAAIEQGAYSASITRPVESTDYPCDPFPNPPGGWDYNVTDLNDTDALDHWTGSERAARAVADRYAARVPGANVRITAYPVDERGQTNTREGFREVAR